ncbi:energy transducer TonB [Fluviicola taffensis]|uniref:energy transducer TonB n=1 Tax=Fluviicola taffensis TaxID=191579 RepID=UPI003137FF0F
MKTCLIFFLLLFSFGTFGQCAKKLNKQLRAELQVQQQNQEDASVLFRKSLSVFDSLKLLGNDQIGVLKEGERKILDRFFTYSALLYQLEELESELPPLISSFKSDEVPVQQVFVEPIRNPLNAVPIFERVSDKMDMGNLSRKEQNKVLKRKLDEYKRYALSNSIRLEEMKDNGDRISAFLPRMDSLGKAYELIANELTSDSWKMQDKLSQLEASFRKKGPNNFPEVYFRIFPDVFPGFLSAESQLNLTAPAYNTVFEDSYPAGIKHSEPDIYESTEDAAVFFGGKDAMDKFIAKNLRYPESVEQGIVFGKVYVKFIVSETGEISAVEVLKGISGCPECGEEAIRLVESMPNWIPGKQNGTTVKSYVGLPVKFEL